MAYLMSIFLKYEHGVALGKRQAVVSEEELQEKDVTTKGEAVVIQLRDYLQFSGSLASKKCSILFSYNFFL